jgi:hypothetical protein
MSSLSTTESQPLTPEQYIKDAEAAGYTDQMYRNWCIEMFDLFGKTYLLGLTLTPSKETFCRYVHILPVEELLSIGI